MDEDQDKEEDRNKPASLSRQNTFESCGECNDVRLDIKAVISKNSLEH